MSKKTTITVSVKTLERIHFLRKHGQTNEDIIVNALDSLDATMTEKKEK